MEDIYCPKCGRGYIEQIDKDKTVKDIVGEENKINYKTKVYRCNDCGYEFIGGVAYESILS